MAGREAKRPWNEWRAPVELRGGAHGSSAKALDEASRLMVGTRQHFLPATYLGGFSEQSSRPARDRKLWVMRRSASAARRATAGSVGWEHNLYRVDAHEGLCENFVDTTWTYE